MKFLKSLRNLRKKRRLHTSLILDFFWFNLALWLLVIATIAAVAIDFSLTSGNYTEMSTDMKMSASDYVSGTRSEKSLRLLLEAGGWLEKLDADRRVVAVEGVKKDDLGAYTESQLIALLGNSESQPYYYSAATIEGGGAARYLLLKLPREKVAIDVYPSESYFLMYFNNRIVIYLILWIALLLFLIFIYSYWVARRIRKPLNKLSYGLGRMIEGDYGTRISIEAEKEFTQIRDAFNYMADMIERTTLEKRRAEESKQRLIVDLSHDLKTPITSIQGYAQALYEGRVDDPERQKRYLNYIHLKSGRVSLLIQHMLDLLKLDSPDYEVKAERREIGEFLREVVADAYGEIERRDFELAVAIPDTGTYAVFDPEPLTRVIHNLLSNALQHNPPGTRLRIGLYEAGDRVEIVLADNGRGIPKELWSTIFDPFVRGDPSRSAEGGTGLGLSIAMRITEKMGGTIRLSGDEEEKTIFTISLRK